ncbi:MAG: MFS transporter [Candidatus Eiseniibacteriota bacterium]
MPVPAGFSAILRTLGHRNFGIYTGGNALSLIGTWMQRIAVGWLAWELTHSGAWLGLVAFADLFPSVIIGPFAGAFADRASRLRIIAVCQVLSMIQAAVLAALTWSGAISIVPLFVLTLLNGIVVGVNQPARLAVVQSLVPRRDLSTAVAINSIIFNTARFIGPAIAGVLIVATSVASCFAANAASFLVLLLALTRVRIDARAHIKPRHGGTLLTDVIEGVRYAARHPGVGPLLVLLLVLSVAVRPFAELLPGFAAQVFGRGADALATLSAIIGISAIIGGLWLAQRGQVEGLGRIALLSTLAGAVSVLGFVATSSYPVALAATAFAGATILISGVSTQTLMQLSVERAMQGRVLSLYGIIFRGAPAIGSLIAGGLSETMGLRWPIAGGCVLCIAVWLWTWRRRKPITQALEARTAELEAEAEPERSAAL